jgi:L-aspartate oxidase
MRDAQVSRAIDFEMKKGGFDCVYLDIAHQPSAFILEHFPNIYAHFDATRDFPDMAEQAMPTVLTPQ